jgi:hypothetical protein
VRKDNEDDSDETNKYVTNLRQFVTRPRHLKVIFEKTVVFLDVMKFRSNLLPQSSFLFYSLNFEKIKVDL